MVLSMSDGPDETRDVPFVGADFPELSLEELRWASGAVTVFGTLYRSYWSRGHFS